jgi:hypothetical protein
MSKHLSGFCGATLAISLAVATALPANSVPLLIPRAVAPSSDTVEVQYQPPVMGPGGFGPVPAPAPALGPGPELGPGPGPAPGPEDAEPGWYRGHRGYRYYRPGYSYYDGYWFPSFLFGALLGSAIAGQPSRVYDDDAHTRWCYERYRSYRAWDDTYQPYYGPRRQCWSPLEAGPGQ